MTAAVCPSREELLEYLAGKLSDAASESLAAHLEVCAECQTALAGLPDPEDTLVSRLRGDAGVDPYQDEPEYPVAIAQAKAAMCGPIVASQAAAEASVTLLPQELGEYRLIERLGSGGMGTVYKARQSRLDRVVALKVLASGRSDDPRAVQRFEREMKAIGRLDHPHIVRAYDAREIDGRLILAMEFVEGLDLKKIAACLGKLAVADACEIARQAALGLQAAHEHGLVHRDVKPSNLMLTPQGQVKLLDLGLARLHAEPNIEEEATGTGEAMGTADYMAPEQGSDSRAVDIRADLYSLGCTLYKLLCGRAPFGGVEYRTALDKMLAHRQAAVRPIDELCPTIPEGLVRVIERLLAKNPESRYSTPGEVAEALAPWCVGADLPALLGRAVDARGEIAIDERRWPEAGRPEGTEATDGRVQASARGGWRRFVGRLMVLAMVGGVGMALGVIIRVQKDGRETTIEVPDGSHARVMPDGQVDVALPGTEKAPMANAAADLKAIEGQWKVVQVQKGKGADAAWGEILGYSPGSAIDPTLTDRLRFIPGSDHWEFAALVFQRNDRLGVFPIGWIYTLTFAIDPGAQPKTIDVLEVTSNQTRLTGLGIYEVDRDQLRLCLSPYVAALKTDQRPKSFKTDSNSAEICFLLKRYQPPADEKDIQGDWAVLREVEDGKAIAEERRRALECFIAGDALSISHVRVAAARKVHERVLSATWSIDVTKQPHRITLFTGNEKLSGIYKLEGDQLTIAYRKGDVAPEAFESKSGSGVTLIVLRRTKGPTLGGTSGEKEAMVAVPAARPPTTEPPVQFSRAVERVINAGGEGKEGQGVEFATGKLVDLPSEFRQWSGQQRDQWAEEKGMDLLVDMSQAMGGSSSPALVPEGLGLAALPDERWETATLGELRSALASGTPDRPDGALNPTVYVHERRGIRYYVPFAFPTTFAIQTRKGDLGILQFVRYTEEPPGMRLRWKMVAKQDQAPQAKVRSVSVVKPVVREVGDYVDLPEGLIVPSEEAQIPARASGNVVKVHCKPGQAVKQGELLVEIDPRLYQAEYEQAQGVVQQAGIRAERCRKEVKRLEELKRKLANVVPEADFERATADRDEAEAALRVAESALEVVRVRLGYTKITAPIAGRISAPVAQVGNLVKAGETVVARVLSTNPMWIETFVPAEILVAIRSKDQLDKIRVLYRLGSDKQGFPHEGKLEFVENQLTTNDMAPCRIAIPNRDDRLIPGMRASVRLVLGPPKPVLVVPQSVLGWQRGEKAVLVINAQNVVQQRPVKLGPAEDGLRVVKEGLNADDRVIVDPGKAGVTPGMTVKPEATVEGRR